MTGINLTSNTGSGFLEADFDQIKDLLQDGGVEPGASSGLVTKTGMETLTNKTLESPIVSGEAYSSEIDNGNSSTADTIDFTTGNFQKSTLTDNCTFTFTAPSGPTTLILKLVQDGTGSRTATWPASVKWPGGTAPTLSTAAASVDIITFYYDGTNYFGGSILDMQ